MKIVFGILIGMLLFGVSLADEHVWIYDETYVVTAWNSTDNTTYQLQVHWAEPNSTVDSITVQAFTSYTYISDWLVLNITGIPEDIEMVNYTEIAYIDITPEGTYISFADQSCDISGVVSSSTCTFDYTCPQVDLIDTNWTMEMCESYFDDMTNNDIFAFLGMATESSDRLYACEFDNGILQNDLMSSNEDYVECNADLENCEDKILTNNQTIWLQANAMVNEYEILSNQAYSDLALANKDLDFYKTSFYNSLYIFGGLIGLSVVGFFIVRFVKESRDF